MALKLVGRSRSKPVFVDADAVIAILPVDTNHRPTPTADTIILLNHDGPHAPFEVYVDEKPDIVFRILPSEK